MKVVMIAAFLQLLRAAVSGQSLNRTVYGSLGEDLLLQCSDGDGSPKVYTTMRWTKDGRELPKTDDGSAATAAPEPSPPPPGQHHHHRHHHTTDMDNGTLTLHGLSVADEGTYLCTASLDNRTATAQTPVQVRVVSGPSNISASMGPAVTLANGTLYVQRGATVSFSCSAASRPAPRLAWSFRGASCSNDSLATDATAAAGRSFSSLEFRIEDVQPEHQGEYRCTARNARSGTNASWSAQLLVYYAPERHPLCVWKLGEDPAQVHFTCSWLGAYPAPTLRWGENHRDTSGRRGPGLDRHLYVSEQNASVALVLNRTELFDGMALKCEAEHPALDPEHQNSCGFVLELPFPEGQPMVTALEGTDKTLTCTEEHSRPPANIAWFKTARQEAIVPGSKYILGGSEEGPALTLTIVNVSTEDEGLYFCRSENPLGVRELEVYLTVKTSAPYSGAIIGIFLAAVIVGAGVIIARALYNRRDRICLGNIFGQVVDDRGDVLSLVESDEDEIFRDTVPRLPPLSLTNGNHTTMVQIHRIPTGEIEDTAVPETSLQRLEDTAPRWSRTEEDTDSTEESIDLVIF